MKNKLTIILIATVVAAPALTQAQSGHGAPNTLRNQGGAQSGSTTRGTLRQPMGTRGSTQSGQNGQRGNSGRGGNTQQTQGGSRGGGMSRTERGGSNHGQTGGQRGGGSNQGQTGGQTGGNRSQGNSLREQLNLSEEQLSKLRAAYKKWKEYAKSIHQNQELSQEEKKAKLKAGFKKYDAEVREILTEEQYAKLQQLRRNSSRPNQNAGNNENGQQNGHSRAEHRRQLRELLQLTEEQLSKLRAIHQYATKKIKAIIANEELTRDEKKKQIKDHKKQAHNRRMEVLTEEQKEKLRQWRARHHSQHQQQSGSGSSGQPRGRTHGNNNGQNPQHQQGGNGRENHSGNSGHSQNGQQTSQSDQVILYVAPGCSYCTKAAKLLKENNVDFVRKDISSDHAARREVAQKTRDANLNWRGGVPVTDARGDIIVGYNRTALSRIE